jgi:hypothetical protein
LSRLISYQPLCHCSIKNHSTKPRAQDIPATHLTILGNWQTRITNRDLEKQSEVALQGVFMQSMMVDFRVSTVRVKEYLQHRQRIPDCTRRGGFSLRTF